MPYMQEIANASNERVYLAVPQGDEVLYLECMYPARIFHLMRTIAGERCKMYCSGLGKAILANLPKEIMTDYASRPKVKFTENTLVDTQALLQDLALTRLRGYAIDNMEHEFGVKCVALPIFDHNQQPCAALSVSGVTLDLAPDKAARLAIRMKCAIEQIQERLN